MFWKNHDFSLSVAARRKLRRLSEWASSSWMSLLACCAAVEPVAVAVAAAEAAVGGGGCLGGNDVDLVGPCGINLRVPEQELRTTWWHGWWHGCSGRSNLQKRHRWRVPSRSLTALCSVKRLAHLAQMQSPVRFSLAFNPTKGSGSESLCCASTSFQLGGAFAL